MPDPFLDNLDSVGVEAPAFNLDTAVSEASQKYGVDEKLIRAVISQESNGKQSAVSPKGATGLMQLMPGTAKALGVDPTDPYQNIMGGTRYLKEQIDSFGGDVPLALAAYNAGPDAVKKHGGIPPYKETQGYLRKIGEALGWPSEAEAAEPAVASGDPFLSKLNAVSGSGSKPAPVSAPDVSGDPFLSKLGGTAGSGGTLFPDLTECTGDSCGDALGKYLNAGPLKATGKLLPRGGIGPGELADVGKSLGSPVYGKEGVSVDSLTPGTVIHMTRKPGDKNYEYGDHTHIGIVDQDAEGNKVFQSFTSDKGWKSEPVDQRFVDELPDKITATSVAGPARAVPVPAAQEGLRFRASVGLKKGLIDLAMKVAGAMPPIPGMSVPATEEALRSFWDSTYDQRASEVKSILSKELFPKGMPAAAPGMLGELTEAAFEMWPAFLMIGAAGPLGAAAGGAAMPAEIAAATLPQLLAASAIGGAVPFAAYGMLEQNPLLGAVKGAAFGAVLGAGKSASSLIANTYARWVSRVAGGAGLGAGGAALEGADSHEMAKQAILFSVMEAFGPPGVNDNIKLWLESKGVTEPAASGMVNTFNDLVSKLQKDRTVIEEGETAKVMTDAAKSGRQLPVEDITRLAAMEREAQITSFGGNIPEGMEGIPQRDYPSTVVPTTQEITKGKGKKARTVEQLAFEEVHPESEKLTGLGPEMTDLYLQKARQENEARIKEAGTQWSRERRRFLDEPLEIDKAPVIFDFGESTAPEARQAIVEAMFPKGKRALAMNAVSKMPPEMTAGEVVGKLKEMFPADAADAMVMGAGRIRFSAGGPEREVAPSWYSRAIEFIGSKLSGQGTGQGFASTIQNWVNKGVVPGKEEIKWTGVVPWLQERQGKVTRQEVVDFLEQNKVQLRVVEAGKYPTDNFTLEQLKEKALAIAPDSDTVDYINRQIDTGWLKEYLADWSEQAGVPAGGLSPKFESYIQPPPSATNYREFYGVWPVATPMRSANRVTAFANGWLVIDPDGVNVFGNKSFSSRGEALNAMRGENLDPDAAVAAQLEWAKKVFTVPGAHQTGDPSADINRVFHAFTWDQVIGGKKYLVIGELQSDWAAKGRKEGYSTGESEYFLIDNNGHRVMGFDNKPAAEDYLKEYADKRYTIREEKTPGTLQFPFSKNWMEVAMKKMLRQTSEEGYDGLAWVSGDVVKERYDLSRQVSRIRYNEKESRLVAYGLDDEMLISEVVPPDKLDQYIGKEAAKKLLEQKPRMAKEIEQFTAEDLYIDDVGDGSFYVMDGADLGGPPIENFLHREDAQKFIDSMKGLKAPEIEVRELAGADLKVGGEWANRQYDQMMPQFMNKYGKQWGARVGEGGIEGQANYHKYTVEWEGSSEKPYAVYDRPSAEGGKLVDRFKSEIEVDTFLSAVDTPDKVHTLAITPKMKDSVLYEGQPMFRDSRGKPVPQVVNEETLRQAFGPESGALISKTEQGDWLVQLPNGANIRVYPNAEIVVDPKAWFIAYKRPYAGEEPYGQWNNINYGGVISLAKEGPATTLFHETFHAAMDLAFTPAEREAVLRKYGTEEKAARAYEEWNPLERPDTLFGKIQYFFKNLLRSMFPGAEEAFQKLRTGEVWTEKPSMRMASEQPMRYSALTDEWNKLKEGPKLGRPSEGAKQAHNTLLKATQRAWAPETVSSEGMATAQEWTKHISNARAEVVRAAKLMNDYRIQFTDMGKDAAYALSAQMERGEVVPAEWRPYMQARQQAFDTVHTQISRIKDGRVGYLTNYAPHLYADPEKAARFFDSIGKRPLEGKKGFLKQRTLPTMDEARANGLEPLFDNPVQQDLAGLMEQWRFVAANDFISGLEKQGLFIPMKTLRPGYAEPASAVPEGWIKADPRVFRAGYAPRDAINVIHNHLMSEAGGLWYNKYKNITAMWNAWHVTLSAFHGMTTMVHGLSMGAWQPIPDLLGAIAAGDHAAAAQALKRVGPMGVVNMFKLAKKGKDEFYNSGKHGDKIATLVKVATEGGQLPEHTMLMQGIAADSFKEMFQQLKGGDIGPAFRSMTHLLGKPIMGYLVPTVKYGSTLLRIEREMDTLQRRYNQKYGSEWSPDVQGNFMKDLQNIAYNERQFSDNIFGEIHPDNMHWNRNIAKGLKGLIAYPGWNIGTLRWLTGMARGVGKLATGKEMDFQARRSLEFGAGLIITTAIANTLLHAALNKGEAPDGWEDVLIGARTGKYLNNGQPERITIASYMKDVAAMATHPGKAMLAKMQAPFSIMQELYQNSDYFGTEIVPAKGTAVDKVAGLGKYIVGKAAPFGFSNITTGKSDLAKYGGLVGFRTVPRALANTPAQNRIDEILHAQAPKSRSAEDADRSRLVSELKELGWNNERGEMVKRIAAARREGLLTEVQAQHIREDMQKDKRVVQFTKLRNIEDAMDVYETGTPEERKLWRPLLSSKWSKVSDEKLRRYRQEYLRIRKLPVAEKMPSRVPPRQSYLIAVEE